jgi:hypothetical protein
MIGAVSLRLLYLIFLQVLGLVVLMGVSSPRAGPGVPGIMAARC